MSRNPISGLVDPTAARSAARREDGHFIGPISFALGRLVCTCKAVVCASFATPEQMDEAFQQHRMSFGLERKSGPIEVGWRGAARVKTGAHLPGSGDYRHSDVYRETIAASMRAKWAKRKAALA